MSEIDDVRGVYEFVVIDVPGCQPAGNAGIDEALDLVSSLFPHVLDLRLGEAGLEVLE